MPVVAEGEAPEATSGEQMDVADDTGTSSLLTGPESGSVSNDEDSEVTTQELDEDAVTKLLGAAEAALEAAGAAPGKGKETDIEQPNVEQDNDAQADKPSQLEVEVDSLMAQYALALLSKAHLFLEYSANQHRMCFPMNLQWLFSL